MSGLTWCALALAPQARAATFAELPFAGQPGVATCLRATGDPGELIRFGPLTRTSSSIDVQHVRDSGPVRTQRVTLGGMLDCPAVAAANGAGVLAAPVHARGRAFELRASLREPGGAFGAPVRVGRASPNSGQPAVAISPSGAAVAVWAQQKTRPGTSPFDIERSSVRILAALRPAGGGFGAVQPLTPWRKEGIFNLPHLAAAIDPAGRVLVAWSRSLSTHLDEPPSATVEMAAAEPGAAFGAVRVLERRAMDVAGPELAVAPDGHVLLAYSPEDKGFQVRERAPGAADFAVVRHSLDPGDPAVAVRSGGGAVVASSTEAGDVEVSVRPGAGALGAPRPLSRDRNHGGFGIGVTLGGGPVIPDDDGNLRVRAMLAPDGAAVLAFGRPGGAFSPARPYVAAGTLTGGFNAAERLGTPLRSANGVAPLRLASGAAAAAWTDNLSAGQNLPDSPRGGGRVHVAAEGATRAPAGRAPHVKITVPPGQRLHADDKLRVRVHCDAACDLRAVARRNGRSMVAADDASLPRAGTARLALAPGFLARSPWDGRTTIAVQAGPPGGQAVTHARVHTHVRQFPVPPLAKPLGVRARRTPAGRVIVTWHTAIPARRVVYLVEAHPLGRDFPRGRLAFRRGRGRHGFRVVLKPRRPVRRVVVRAIAMDPPQRTRSVSVPVSG